MSDNSTVILTATFKRDYYGDNLPAPVSVSVPLHTVTIEAIIGYGVPPTADRFTLDNVLDGTATLCGQNIYRKGIITCGNCKFGMAEACPYATADCITIDNKDYSAEDADFIPLCPVRYYGLTEAFLPDNKEQSPDYTERSTGTYSAEPDTTYWFNDPDPDPCGGHCGTFDI